MIEIIVGLTLSLLGVIICNGISFYLFSTKNTISDLICKTNSDTCRSLFTSSLGRISKHLNLGDIGLVYFSATLLFSSIVLLLSDTYETAILVLALPFTLAFLATFISLFYQRIVLKKWCRICLSVIVIIWAQFVICMIRLARYHQPDLSDDHFVHQLITTGILYIMCVAICCGWFNYKISFAKQTELKKNNELFTAWKQNPDVFYAVLKKQKRIPKELWENDLLLGNEHADIRLLTATNPYCRACAVEYFRLQELLLKYPDNVNLTIRLNIKPEIAEKNLNLASKYLISAFISIPGDNDKKQIFNTWFRTMNLTEWKKVFSKIELLNDYESFFEASRQFYKDNAISHTPQLFVNGYRFPDVFDLNDLAVLIPSLLQKEKDIVL